MAWWMVWMAAVMLEEVEMEPKLPMEAETMTRSHGRSEKQRKKRMTRMIRLLMIPSWLGRNRQRRVKMAFLCTVGLWYRLERLLVWRGMFALALALAVAVAVAAALTVWTGFPFGHCFCFFCLCLFPINFILSLFSGADAGSAFFDMRTDTFLDVLPLKIFLPSIIFSVHPLLSSVTFYCSG